MATIALARRIAAERIFEADRARHDAAVEFGQSHVHGNVAARKAARIGGPRFARLACEYGLQHRHVECCQRIKRTCRKTGEVDRNVGRGRGKFGREIRADIGVF